MSTEKNNICYGDATEEIKARFTPLITSESLRKIKAATGWKDQTIRRWKDGSLPSAGRIEAACKILGISLKWLLTGEEEVSI